MSRRSGLTESRWVCLEGSARSSRDDSTCGTVCRNTDACQELYLLCNVRRRICGLEAWSDGRQASTTCRLRNQAWRLEVLVPNATETKRVEMKNTTKAKRRRKERKEKKNAAMSQVLAIVVMLPSCNGFIDSAYCRCLVMRSKDRAVFLRKASVRRSLWPPPHGVMDEG